MGLYIYNVPDPFRPRGLRRYDAHNTGEVGVRDDGTLLGARGLALQGDKVLGVAIAEGGATEGHVHLATDGWLVVLHQGVKLGIREPAVGGAIPPALGESSDLLLSCPNARIGV